MFQVTRLLDEVYRHSGSTGLGHDAGADGEGFYSLNLMDMFTRRALAEIAKALLHISNIACLPKEEMEVRSVVVFCCLLLIDSGVHRALRKTV